MKMKCREVSIVTDLVKADTGIPIRNISKHYDVTERLIYYDIKDINKWLTSNQLGEIVIIDQSLFLITTKRKKVQKELQKRLYNFSRKERSVFEYFMIVLSYQPIYLSTFQEYFDICKSAAVIDLNKIKKSLEDEKLNFLFLLKQGYKVEGDELIIRRMSEVYLDKLNPCYINLFDDLKKVFQNSLVYLTKKDIDYFRLAEEFVKQYENSMKSQSHTSNVNFECFMIILSWIRSMKGYTIIINEKRKRVLHDTKSYKVVVKNSKKLKQYGLCIPENEFYYIAVFLEAVQNKGI